MQLSSTFKEFEYAYEYEYDFPALPDQSLYHKQLTFLRSTIFLTDSYIVENLIIKPEAFV
jgi:hypothetical protein